MYSLWQSCSCQPQASKFTKRSGNCKGQLLRGMVGKSIWSWWNSTNFRVTVDIDFITILRHFCFLAPLAWLGCLWCCSPIRFCMEKKKSLVVVGFPLYFTHTADLSAEGGIVLRHSRRLGGGWFWYWECSHTSEGSTALTVGSLAACLDGCHPSEVMRGQAGCLQTALCLVLLLCPVSLRKIYLLYWLWLARAFHNTLPLFKDVLNLILLPVLLFCNTTTAFLMRQPQRGI